MTWRIYWQDSRTGRIGMGVLKFNEKQECAKLCDELNADYPQFKHLPWPCDDTGKPLPPEDNLLTFPMPDGKIAP